MYILTTQKDPNSRGSDFTILRGKVETENCIKKEKGKKEPLAKQWNKKRILKYQCPDSLKSESQ